MNITHAVVRSPEGIAHQQTAFEDKHEEYTPPPQSVGGIPARGLLLHDVDGFDEDDFTGTVPTIFPRGARLAPGMRHTARAVVDQQAFQMDLIANTHVVDAVPKPLF